MSNHPSSSPFGDPDSDNDDSKNPVQIQPSQKEESITATPSKQSVISAIDIGSSSTQRDSPPLVDLLDNPFHTPHTQTNQLQVEEVSLTNKNLSTQQPHRRPHPNQSSSEDDSVSISRSRSRSKSTESGSSTEALERELDALESEEEGDQERDGLMSTRNRNRGGRRSNLNSARNRNRNQNRMGESSVLRSVSNLGGNAFKSLTSIGRKVSRAAEKEREELELSRSRLSMRGSRYLENQDDDEGDGDEEEEIDLEDQAQGSEGARRTSKGKQKMKERDNRKSERMRNRDLRRNLGRLSGKERAKWEWANVEDLDEFLREVYDYYIGKGIFCIILSRVLNLLTIAFVIFFSTFLVGCIDYSRIRHDGNLQEVLVASCFSRFSTFTLLGFILLLSAYGYQVLRFSFAIKRLFAMQRFYVHLLEVPDADVQSIPWNVIISKLSNLVENIPLPSQLPSTSSNQPQRLNAHEIANRIMRRENYLIALFNKDVLNLSLQVPNLLTKVPILGEMVNGGEGMLTRSLEWNIDACLMGYLFDRNGRVRNQFLKEKYRGELVEGLKRRFIFMALLNTVFAPFIVLYLLIFSFFRYFEEYHKDPSNLGSRQYTSFAKWKLREFNELPHIFRRRCHHSYPYAKRYIDQFPKERVAILARFVSFIAGSFTAVLLLASVIDPDLFLHFDITSQRNVLFYIGVFGAVLAVSRGVIPADEHVNFEPELLLRAIIRQTHYMPQHWKGRLHSTEVHQEFGKLYTLKIGIFLMEIFGVVLTPFVLWLSLPRSAPAIVDFFREFTVHVDGLGCVCSFAVFNFERNGNVRFGAPAGTIDERMASKEGKMEQSFMGFKAANPDWLPADPSGSLFLSRIIDGTAVPFPYPSSSARNSSPNNGNGQDRNGFGGGIGFTPVNSTLALRSQAYEEAFAKSISLGRATKNAGNLSNGSIKRGQSSTYNDLNKTSSSNRDAGGRRLTKVDELAANNSLDEDEEDSKDDSRKRDGGGPLEKEQGEEDVDLASYHLGEDDREVEEALQREREELEWENREGKEGVGTLFRNIYEGRARW